MNAALLFEPDGYLLTGPSLMGRQSAGNGFLRAAVSAVGAAAGAGPLKAYTAHRSSADVFTKTVADIDPKVATAWIPGARLDLLAEAGVLYRPDAVLWPHARARLRIGPAAYSLCGVTHTLATSATLDVIGRMLTEPLMAWDALVCTSSAALTVATTVLEAQADYLRWRTGHAPAAGRPLLPVIPLGVHTQDFAFREADRAAARATLGLGPDDVAALFAGRLSVVGKSHPYAMFHALQRTAKKTGKPVVLVMAGQAHTPGMGELFSSALAQVCPDVRPVFVDGKDAAAYRAAWAGCDLFISLADSIQETFGITPLEAMAAGLPAVVSDWNGYKDTVRDGIDGFRIRTATPPPGAGASIGLNYETGALSYEQYLMRSNTAVAIDIAELTTRLCDLVRDPALRHRLGHSGQARARAEFDWAVVFRRYQALWDEQTAVRRRAAEDPRTAAWLAAAPRRASDHLGPFDTFAAYPTAHVSAATVVSHNPAVTKAAYRDLIALEVNALWKVAPEIADRVLDALAAGPASIGDIAAVTGIDPLMAMEVATRLAKIDVVALNG